MTTVEEVRAQLDRLKARVKEYQAALHEAGTAQEKADIKGKIATCRTAIRHRIFLQSRAASRQRSSSPV